MKRPSIQRRSERSLVPVAVAAFLATSVAQASPNYPATIQDTLAMPCAPTCELCHLTAIGRGGNATQPFALAMVDAGLAPGDPDLLASLLTSLSANPDAPDSDADGVTDVAELEAEAPTDPNDATGASICGGGAEYGCGVAEGRSFFGAPLLLGMLGALGLVARRRLRTSSKA